MIKREYTPKRTVCKVTFTVPKNWAEESIAIAGDFNNWDTTADMLELKKDVWQIQLRLKPNTSYIFKYFIDGERWENDEAADEYVANKFGTEDSIIHIKS